VIQWCYSGVTVVLQRLFSGVAVVADGVRRLHEGLLQGVVVVVVVVSIDSL
jgi:hypothetical protein